MVKIIKPKLMLDKIVNRDPLFGSFWSRIARSRKTGKAKPKRMENSLQAKTLIEKPPFDSGALSLRKLQKWMMILYHIILEPQRKWKLTLSVAWMEIFVACSNGLFPIQ